MCYMLWLCSSSSALSTASKTPVEPNLAIRTAQMATSNDIGFNR